MLYAILSGFILAVFAPLVIHVFGRKGGWLLALLPLALFIYFFTFITKVELNQSFYFSYAWFPNLNINLNFRLDGLSLLFTLLITGIGSVIFMYAEGYLGNHPQLGRFYSFLLLFMAAMLGTVLCNNLIGLFIFWELTSLSSFLLIGFHSQRDRARAAAVQGLLVTSAGGLALLLGFLLLGQLSGTYEFSHMLSRINNILSSPWYTPILILILLGAFTKSAQFPFHFWLPAAMEAPTPVSAYLHSATMVNLGIYLLGRLHPILANHPLWYALITTTGALTMLTGALLALRETDIKLILAYTTVIALGALVFLLGTNSEVTMQAVIAFLLAHALYKGTLFMCAGNIDHNTGIRNIYALHGLRKSMPITFLITLIAAASMAGLPPLFGFFAKELIYESSHSLPIFSVLLTGITIFAMMVTAMLSIKLVIKPFFGSPLTIDHPPSACNRLWLSPLVLALITVLFGLMPYLIDQELIGSAASAIFNHSIEVNLSYTTGFTAAVKLSLLTLSGAIVLFIFEKKLYNLLQQYNSAFQRGPARAYEIIINGLLQAGKLTTKLFQSGYLRAYLTLLFLAFIGMISPLVITKTTLNTFQNITIVVDWFTSILILFILCCAISLLLFRSYMISIILLGMIGLGNTLIFLAYGAPDVAMTQILVDTLVVIIVVLALYKQPMLPHPEKTSRKWHWFKIIVATLVGLTISLLLIQIMLQPFPKAISEYYWKNGALLAHGHNIVNLILVDFRAIDTLGEIIVIATAAIGIYSLIKLKK